MDLRKFSIEGKTALINGAAHTYGAEIAEGLRSAGAKVFLAGADKAELDRLQKQTQANGVIVYSQRTEADAEAFAAEVERVMGVPDIFVENSAHVLLTGWKHTFEEIYDNFSVTQTGMILTVKHIGMLMAKKGAGSVIFVSDYAALVGADAHNYDEAQEMLDTGFSLNYGFVSGCYVNYARQAAGYLGENGIRCNCIAFSPMAKDVQPGFAERYIKHSHLKRSITAEDIQAAAVFLGSDASGFITGTTIPVDGGYTAK